MGETPLLGWVEIEKVSTIMNALIMYEVRNIIIINYNWIHIGISFFFFLFNHSLNDKSLQVMGIHDLNNGKSNISKLYLE